MKRQRPFRPASTPINLYVSNEDLEILVHGFFNDNNPKKPLSFPKWIIAKAIEACDL